MLVYSDLYAGVGLSQWLSVITHGAAMDMTVAGYLTVLPALLTIATVMTGFDSRGRIMSAYYWGVALLMASVQTLDLLLYGYWNFKLDTTPLFYFMTSPSAAFASASVIEMVCGVIGLALLTLLYYMVLRYTAGAVTLSRVANRRVLTGITLTLVTGLLFIPIRGGVTVSTMNLSRAYFSSDTRLNHAAVNPAFSLLYSATHQADFSRQYCFFDNDEADRIFAATVTADSDSVAQERQLLNTARPDIVLVILESFSSHLLPSQGGEAVAMRLDSIAREGLLFTNFYASSFRTDRALPAILSGFPGQPTTSVMKFVDKTEHLPSIAASLGEQGYDLSYYYGGDINFTNMLAYLVNSGFSTIVRDTDFPIADRTGKWGAHDHLVFDRCLRSLEQVGPSSAPRFTVVQTSSSHEPFQVPYDNPRFPEGPVRAFAYADSCLGHFVDKLKDSPRWDNTLVIIVPDHLGAYPKNLSDLSERHHVPLVMTGGALALKGREDSPASQTDIAATLLGAMGIDHSQFKFSRDILQPGARHSAFFTEPEWAGMVTPTDTVAINLTTMEVSPGADTLSVRDAKATLQAIYTELSRL
ncbi:MAG: LTA synthase family protein [Muribaculaceae bacterium]|nr:LTA synthase family protein [Muribaculaceae bacterium]